MCSGDTYTRPGANACERTPCVSGATKLRTIIILTYFVALGGFAHIIAGSVDTLYGVSIGFVTWSKYLGGFLAPTLVGDIIGGVSLVAFLNHAQVAAETTGHRSRSPSRQ